MFADLTIRPNGLRHRRQLSRPAAVLMMLVALIFLAVGVGVGIGKAYFLVTAESGQGQVVEIVERTKYNSKLRTRETSYYPVVELETKAGKKARFTSNVGANPAMYVVGDQVPVVYDPEDPSSAAIDTLIDFWMLPLVFVLIALTLLIVSVARLRRRY